MQFPTGGSGMNSEWGEYKILKLFSKLVSNQARLLAKKRVARFVATSGERKAATFANNEHRWPKQKLCQRPGKTPKALIAEKFYTWNKKT